MESIKEIKELDIRVEQSEDLIEALTEVVEKGQLISQKEKLDITFSKEGTAQVLEISQVRIEGNKAYY